jgi:hypothetical protein
MGENAMGALVLNPQFFHCLRLRLLLSPGAHGAVAGAAPGGDQ